MASSFSQESLRERWKVEEIGSSPFSFIHVHPCPRPRPATGPLAALPQRVCVHAIQVSQHNPLWVNLPSGEFRGVAGHKIYEPFTSSENMHTQVRLIIGLKWVSE